jgi:hypothetical protein
MTPPHINSGGSLIPIDKASGNWSEEASGKVEILLQECDEMEACMGAWLGHIVVRFDKPNAEAKGVNDTWPSLPPQLWRTLMIVWLTSPFAKREFSDEARQGMRSTVDSLDDSSLVFYAKGLLIVPYSFKLRPEYGR